MEHGAAGRLIPENQNVTRPKTANKKNMTMSTINETEQPVKAAITEADVLAFIATKQKQVSVELADTGPFAIAPEVYFKGAYIAVTAYMPPSCVSAVGVGQTVADAIAAFRRDYTQKLQTPAKLRDQAARLLEDADELESKMGGAK
jgi:hypothetical protein